MHKVFQFRILLECIITRNLCYGSIRLPQLKWWFSEHRDRNEFLFLCLTCPKIKIKPNGTFNAKQGNSLEFCHGSASCFPTGFSSQCVVYVLEDEPSVVFHAVVFHNKAFPFYMQLGVTYDLPRHNLQLGSVQLILYKTFDTWLILQIETFCVMNYVKNRNIRHILIISKHWISGPSL